LPILRRLPDWAAIAQGAQHRPRPASRDLGHRSRSAIHDGAHPWPSSHPARRRPGLDDHRPARTQAHRRSLSPRAGTSHRSTCGVRKVDFRPQTRHFSAANRIYAPHTHRSRIRLPGRAGARYRTEAVCRRHANVATPPRQHHHEHGCRDRHLRACTRLRHDMGSRELRLERSRRPHAEHRAPMT
jgi:hypothetical protein